LTMKRNKDLCGTHPDFVDKYKDRIRRTFAEVGKR